MNLINYENIDEELIRVVPEFSSFYEEHVKDNDEVLPHVLFGDFTRFFINVFQKSKVDSEASTLLTKCVNFIESLFESEDQKVLELVQVSFIENLQDQNDVEEIKNLFSNKVKNSFNQVLKG